MREIIRSKDETVVSVVDSTVSADPARPLLTWYDDADGERTELSGATLANWVAKTANLLVDGCGLGPGDEADIWLPPHWQGAAVLLGTWSAGLAVRYGEPVGAGADVAFAATTVIHAVPADVPFADGVPERYALGLDPLGQPMRQVPTGWADYIVAARAHGDHFAGPPVRPDTPAWVDPDGTVVDHATLLARAAEHATSMGIEPGTRVLIDADAYPAPIDWLLAPLVAGATLVICTRTDATKLASRAASERVAAVLPSTVPRVAG